MLYCTKKKEMNLVFYLLHLWINMEWIFLMKNLKKLIER